MNFVIDLAHRGVSVAQWQSIGARNLPEGLWFDSLWVLGIISLFHARDKTKNIFLKKKFVWVIVTYVVLYNSSFIQLK